MAVYTHVDDKQLSDYLSTYDIGTAISFKGIAEGSENSNYLLETDQARFILTLYERRANPADLPYFLDLMEHLADAGINAPRPVHDRAGAALKTLADRQSCIISFLNGVSVDEPQESHCSEAGKLLAALHNAAADFSQTRPNDLALKGWADLVSDTVDQSAEVSPEMPDLLSSELAYLQGSWPADLPTGTIHADMFPDNVLFMDGKASGVIDFYFACHDMLAYDLAITMNSWCFDKNHEFCPAKAKARS